jgi:UDP-N-acetylmuramate--alanine ligase
MTHIHLIGIGGTGLSAIARVLLESGYTVSGSDRVLSPLAQDLRAAGVAVSIGHAPQNVAGADLVVRSSAIPDDNPEVVAALAAGIPVLKRSDFLGRLTDGKRVVAVAGTHGKTTTTAMIAWMLAASGEDPSYIIGSVAKNLGANAHAGSGEVFVIEADEYDRMFLGLHPEIIVLTTVEHDHPDDFPTFGDYMAAFEQFVDRLLPGGTLIGCLDDPGAAALLQYARARSLKTASYGLSEAALYRAETLQPNAHGGFTFDALYPTPEGAHQPVERVELQVPGEHNVRNALAALAVSHHLHLDGKRAAAALGEYQGAVRRFDLRGEIGGITIIDDYAHHPTEIRATLAAARVRFPNRPIWAVWQPHTYSRTRTLMTAFEHAFQDADHVLVTEIYAAREPHEDFSSASLVRAMTHPSAAFAATFPDAVQTLLAGVRPGDVVLVFSAGDADRISADLMAALQERTPSHG